MSGGRSLVQKSPYPPEPYHSVLIEWEVEAIPAAMGGLFLSAQKYFTTSPSDAKRRRWAMNRSMVYMLQGAGDRIVAAIDRMYTLQDWFFNANRYEYTPGVDGVAGTYEPPLPATPNINLFNSTGAGPILHTLMWASYNLLNGQTTPDYGFEDPRNIRQQLADILAALEAGTAGTEELDLLRSILITLGGAV